MCSEERSIVLRMLQIVVVRTCAHGVLESVIVVVIAALLLGNGRRTSAVNSILANSLENSRRAFSFCECLRHVGDCDTCSQFGLHNSCGL